MSIKAAIEEFTERLHHLIESDAMERARAAVLLAFGAGAPKKRGRPPKNPASLPALARKARRKGPVQLCPVPGCKNKAAPIFGMVCSDHKDLPKAKIKKYREARRAAKLAGKPAPKKRGRKPGPQKAVRKLKSKRRAPPVAKSTPKRRAAAVTKKAQPIAKETPTAPATPAAA
jgi:hypothetical protein